MYECVVVCERKEGASKKKKHRKWKRYKTDFEQKVIIAWNLEEWAGYVTLYIWTTYYGSLLDH